MSDIVKKDTLRHQNFNVKAFQWHIECQKPGHCATLMYTSGTLDLPKESHGWMAAEATLPLSRGEVAILQTLIDSAWRVGQRSSAQYRSFYFRM